MITNVFALSETCREQISPEMQGRFAIQCEYLGADATLTVTIRKFYEILGERGFEVAYSTAVHDVAIVRGVLLKLLDKVKISRRRENPRITRLHSLLARDGIRSWDSVKINEQAILIAQLTDRCIQLELTIQQLTTRLGQLSSQVEIEKKLLRNALARERHAKESLVPTETDLPKESEFYGRHQRYEERFLQYFRNGETSEKNSTLTAMEKLSQMGKDAPGFRTKKFWKPLPGIPHGSWYSRASDRLRFLWILQEDAVILLLLDDKDSKLFGR